ncbi:Hypothetical predicted protein [Marmota monax]|uniref:Uncharacterized protein n=1 Tax=Marmota monax TaxID=9995 RepID=A0A5E4AML1_MARMO|nr:hypothetical protein GHT09_016277 [Marmota monax]VTJ58693.1 Hypothetical predicted protein [Marmota monax]
MPKDDSTQEVLECSRGSSKWSLKNLMTVPQASDVGAIKYTEFNTICSFRHSPGVLKCIPYSHDLNTIIKISTRKT